MAFSTKDLLGLVAMPLAVAVVAEASGVPQDQLQEIVSSLNQANVPPTEFVEVVRYVPVVVAQPVQPAFSEFVRSERTRGLTGSALTTSITRRLETTYNVTPQFTYSEPATTYVAQPDYIPTTTIASNNPLALIALPLAVAAVADLAGVPQSQLADLVASLNGANVPVAQEIQIIRYVPVALVNDSGPQFVEFVQSQVSQGVTGPSLVPVVVDQLQTFYPQPQQIVVTQSSQPFVVDRDFVPQPVVTRMTEFHGNPHGGPPGQLKKQLGLRTGAEVMHGTRPAVVVPQQQPMISSSPVEEHGRRHGNGNGHGRGHKKNVQFVAPPQPVMVPQQQPAVVQQPAPMVIQQRGNQGNGNGNGRGQGGGEDHGNGKGKGKGKGHGKDR